MSELAATIEASSAPAWPQEIKLVLPPSKQMPRELLIGWDRYCTASTHIHCHAFCQGKSIAYAGCHDPLQVRLDYEIAAPQLWLDGAMFDLTTAEAAEIERVFGPMGLKVNRS